MIKLIWVQTWVSRRTNIEAGGGSSWGKKTRKEKSDMFLSPLIYVHMLINAQSVTEEPPHKHVRGGRDSFREVSSIKFRMESVSRELWGQQLLPGSVAKKQGSSKIFLLYKISMSWIYFIYFCPFCSSFQKWNYLCSLISDLVAVTSMIGKGDGKGSFQEVSSTSFVKGKSKILAHMSILFDY